MYGVIGLFDEHTGNKIRTIWEELKEQSISFYAEEVVDRKPHITLASYKEMNEAEFSKKMAEIYKAQSCVDISFPSLGSFLNSGALYLAPLVTNELLDLHKRHHEQFACINHYAQTLYSPNQWIPHCTLANRLTQEKLSQAFIHCLKREQPIAGKITEVALIRVEGNKAPVISSVKLKPTGRAKYASSC
ncbi:2'-5' RNA ligase family protein [Bacillus sp. AK031]